MTEELRHIMLNHVSKIEFTVKRLHEQAHTGVIRLDSGYAHDALSSCNELRRLLLEFKIK